MVFEDQNKAILEDFAARILSEETLDKAYKSAIKGGNNDEAEENQKTPSKMAGKRKAKEERDKAKKALKKARQKHRKERESVMQAQREAINAALGKYRCDAEEMKGDTQTQDEEEDDSALMVSGSEPRKLSKEQKKKLKAKTKRQEARETEELEKKMEDSCLISEEKIELRGRASNQFGERENTELAST